MGIATDYAAQEFKRQLTIDEIPKESHCENSIEHENSSVEKMRRGKVGNDDCSNLLLQKNDATLRLSGKSNQKNH
jgi:hypothetical protein